MVSISQWVMAFHRTLCVLCVPSTRDPRDAEKLMVSPAQDVLVWLWGCLHAAQVAWPEQRGQGQPATPPRAYGVLSQSY